ncbi:MAG: hypothetical protein GY937_09475 [bacterium]|nr:hypothetical protein [bacterium]
MIRRRTIFAISSASTSILALLGCATIALAASDPIILVSPEIDHHDRIEAIATRLIPRPGVFRVDLERSGGQGSRDWYPAFGAPRTVPLGAGLVVLENAPASALARLKDPTGRPFDEALVGWVESGHRLLIVGGSPSLESYAGTRLEALMGFSPAAEPGGFRKRNRSKIRGPDFGRGHVDRLHEGVVTSARVRLWAGNRPFVLENRIGAGTVTVVLSGAQGQLRADGPEDPEEWFASETWADFLRAEVELASKKPLSLGPEPSAAPAVPAPTRDSFDIRYFAIGSHPYPFALAPGEAWDRAAELRNLGFTSVILKAHPRRPRDDLQALGEIARAGLQIVYYHSLVRKSGKERFEDLGTPPRGLGFNGEDMGWDIHDTRFRKGLARLLDDRPGVTGLPLRAVQVVEEFQDGGMTSPSLQDVVRAHGLRGDEKPGDPRWIELQALRADATRETFDGFRAIARHLFPGLPQSTYWPASYWYRPDDYTYRLSALAGAVDEIFAPGYGYAYERRGGGPASVRRSASEAWSALQYSPAGQRYLAIYALGRPLKRNGPQPDAFVWKETAWTALAHGANGLAYWALPTGPALASLGPLHEEIGRLGPWLAALPRTPAPVALLESWTSRSEALPERTKELSTCLRHTHEALELGFEDVDHAFEERLAVLPASTRALVLIKSPSLAEEAIPHLRRFVARGGHLFVDGQSAKRTQPGRRPLDLAAALGHPSQIHSVPTLGSCQGLRISLAAASKNWQLALTRAGLRARADTAAPDTEATLRGGPELWIVFGLNHGAQPQKVRARLSFASNDYEWTELRSGASTPPQGSHALTSTHDVAPGEAVVWMAARRPAVAMNTDVVPAASGSRLQIDVRDAEGEPVAEGYPIHVEIGGDVCARPRTVHTTLEGGNTEIPLFCENAEVVNGPIPWIVRDPLSGLQATSLNGPERP